MSVKKDAPKSPLPFEEAMHKLEEIVSEMEGGELSLEKSLTSFEEGMRLAKICEDRLNDASGRVEKIMKDFSGSEKAVPVDDGEFAGRTGGTVAGGGDDDGF